MAVNRLMNAARASVDSIALGRAVVDEEVQPLALGGRKHLEQGNQGHISVVQQRPQVGPDLVVQLVVVDHQQFGEAPLGRPDDQRQAGGDRGGQGEEAVGLPDHRQDHRR